MSGKTSDSPPGLSLPSRQQECRMPLPIADETQTPKARIHVVTTPPLAPVDLPPLEDFLMDAADLDPETCPPDMRFFLGDREAWVYDHGDVADLIFVRV